MFIQFLILILMKTILAFLSLLLLYTSAQAATKLVISNNDQAGNNGWQNPANWLPAGVPQSGDLVIIPLGKTITIKGNVYPAAVSITVFIEGTLDFDPSGKLNLQSGSLVQLFSSLAKITSNGVSSEQVVIGGGIKYNGQNDGTITGPAFANVAAPNSTAAIPGVGFYVGVLPVQVTGFTARQKEGSVSLSWTTQLEEAIKSFEVQRSNNTVDWTTVSAVSPRSTCHCVTPYSAIDKAAPRGKNYYRLLIRDWNGSIQYSQIASLQMDGLAGDEVSYSINESGSALKLYLEGAKFTFPV
ncbi:MAG TPA: hypothetical protein VM935_14320, partial [Chitinophagaceae bacterium]|nr:hypothetical protein [Chitinophagaceae bacterium]